MANILKGSVCVWALALLLAVAPAAPGVAGEWAFDGEVQEWIQLSDEGAQLAAQPADGDVLLGGIELAQAKDEADDVNDPLEPLNRIIFTFNEGVRTMILGPLALLYDLIFPDIIKEAIGSAIDNLNTPVILANDLLQGEGQRAWQTTQRFLINSTLGLAGFIDVADKWLDIPKHDEDFGQTLAVWGVGEWFYLIVPIFGPSNPRDAFGKLLVDGYLDPLNLWLSNTDRDEYIYLRSGVTAVHKYGEVKEELDQIRKTSVDFYAALRSMYRQRRESEIRNGAITDLPPIPDLSYDLDDDVIEPDEGTAGTPAKSGPDQLSDKSGSDQLSEVLPVLRPVLRIVPFSEWEDRDRL